MNHRVHSISSVLKLGFFYDWKFSWTLILKIRRSIKYRRFIIKILVVAVLNRGSQKELRKVFLCPDISKKTTIKKDLIKWDITDFIITKLKRKT